MTDAARMGSPENPPMGSVYDIPGWLKRNFPALTGALRSSGNAVPSPVGVATGLFGRGMRGAADLTMLPVDVAADLLSRGVHGAAGLNRPEGENYSGPRVDALLKSLSDTWAPLKDAAGTLADKGREGLLARGATPSGPIPAAPAPGGAFAAPTSQPTEPQTPIWQAMGPPASAQRAPVVARAPGGAFPAEPSAAAPAATLPTQEGAFAQSQEPQIPPAVAKSLADEFRRRSAEIDRDPEGKLSKDQKAQMELDFFLGLMAKSAQPGARMLGAFGESGLNVSKNATAEMDKNYTRSQDKIRRQREDLYQEIGLSDKDEDNKRDDARQKAEERRWQAAEGRDKERLQLERDRLKADGKDVRQSIINDKGYYVHILKDGTEVVSKVKAKPNANELNPVDEAMGAIGRYFPNETTGERWDRMIGMKRNTENASDKLADFAAKVYADPILSQEDANAKIAMYRQSLGLPGEQGGQIKPSTEAAAHAMAKDAIKKGKDPAAVNKRLQEWGYKPL